MRTLVDLERLQVEALDRLAKGQDRSRAALIREAVDEFLARHGRGAVEEAFGSWAPEAPDGLVFQEQARREW
ncbi:MAG TPA: ribbon-helix-helix protein, CopG family [Amaricoccus sp.]|jgi:predicted transcriptional regulator|nr:ribbon-helix-helix protein, CopG family [Amaricoccus sp.]